MLRSFLYNLLQILKRIVDCFCACCGDLKITNKFRTFWCPFNSLCSWLQKRPFVCFLINFMGKGLAKWNWKSGWNSTRMSASWNKWLLQNRFHSLWKEWERHRLSRKHRILCSVGMSNLGDDSWLLFFNCIASTTMLSICYMYHCIPVP